MTSYHRIFNLCKVYKEPIALKIYPTWEKSDHGVLIRIAKKYRRAFQQNMLSKPSAGSKMKVEDVLQVPSAKHCKLSTSVVSKPQGEPLCKISWSAVKHVPLHVKF